MAYPTNTDALITLLKEQLDTELGNGRYSSAIDTLEKLQSIRLVGSGGGGGGASATDIGNAVNGTPITGESLEAGGAGGTGWLSSLRKALAPPRTRTTSSVVITTALTESTFTLSNVRQFEIGNRSSVPLRYSFVANNTINGANFTSVSRNTMSRSESDILVTGTLYVSAESLPTPLAISSTTTSGSPTVTTAASFSSAIVGQAISGTGILANTRIGSINAAGTSLTLVGSDGATPVNATASGTVSLTIAGAVVRLSTWS
jgi:ABC-type iron transport system FetAB permease component